MGRKHYFYKCRLVHRELQAISLTKLSSSSAMPCPSVLKNITWSAIQPKGDKELTVEITKEFAEEQ